MMAAAPSALCADRVASAELLQRLRSHAAPGLEPAPPNAEPAALLQRQKPQLKAAAAKALMEGTAAMLAVVESWADGLVEQVCATYEPREAAQRDALRAHVDFSQAEVAKFCERLISDAAEQRQSTVRDLTKTLASKADADRETSAQALRTGLEAATRQHQAQCEELQRELAAERRKVEELVAKLATKEEQLVASSQRVETAKQRGESRLKGLQMGRDALTVKILRLERELASEKHQRLALQTRKQAAAALWGKASDGVATGQLWATLASAAEEASDDEEPAAETAETADAADVSDEGGEAAAAEPELPGRLIVRTPAKTAPDPSDATTTPTLAVPEAAAAEASSESPLFESPSAPAEQIQERSSKKKGAGDRGTTGRRGSSASRRPASASPAATPTAARLRRRASTGGGSGAPSFMSATKASGARSITKKSADRPVRKALTMRTQGMGAEGESVRPAFDAGGFPIEP